MRGIHLDLQPLTPEDIPDPETPEFQQFLNDHFALGMKLIETMSDWNRHSSKHDSTVQILDLPSSSSFNHIRKTLGIKEFWCGRESRHTEESLRNISHRLSSQKVPQADNTIRPDSFSPTGLVRNLSRRFSRQPGEPHSGQAPGKLDGEQQDRHVPEETRQARVMSSTPDRLYERFRRGLLEYHSQNEREYIKACRETECLHVYQKHVAEVWRLTYKTPPPTNPRTFVVLLLCRELISEPQGERAFMNISLPFSHPGCMEKKGNESKRVRGRYVSVERVQEMDKGRQVEWRMATSSDAGGNIPRFMTNSSLPNSIAEDVPSFLSWMVDRFPGGNAVASKHVDEA
ncbi:hypothetical protein I307_01304 [Cryptococcus deuterogattii 99/473]|uniref:DUF3074 domain-containing protein n=1 Tax=Cryptococcus deuterogattii Ram5 TaxID=1296110 RepID=A0A0D0T158_9TREE|nr:hypothetical protein I313_04448 [Cryptococcus deuterogattii Ram5]KIY59057.1 hypothetical protein I307_01304 [Cryptococcus deuterogattii 99/473]